jgi:hypothetical protein
MLLANVFKSVGYADTVLFLTIFKSEIYKEKFRQVSNMFLPELPINIEIGYRLI